MPAHSNRKGNASTRARFKTGKNKRKDVKQSERSNPGTGPQKQKRVKLTHGVRIETGRGIVETRASRATGVFDGVPSTRTVMGGKPGSPKYQYPIETGRMYRAHAENGRKPQPFANDHKTEYRITPPAHGRPSSTAK